MVKLSDESLFELVQKHMKEIQDKAEKGDVVSINLNAIVDLMLSNPFSIDTNKSVLLVAAEAWFSENKPELLKREN